MEQSILKKTKIVFRYTDYRDVLKEELRRRCRQNPRYSQGAFARDLDIRPNRLSEILKGKQGVSVKVAENLAERIGLKNEEKHFFCDLVQSVHARSRIDRDTANLRIQKYKTNRALQNLQDDVFRILTEWHHLALVELTRLNGFRNEATWIAKALRIPKDEVKISIERLVRVNLLERHESKLVATRYEKVFRAGLPADFFRTFQVQLLEKAKEALLSQCEEENFNQSQIMSLNQDDFCKIKEILDRNFKECRSIYNASDRRDAVYCLTTQLFQVSTDVK